MPAYRIYWFDRDHHVIEVDVLIADADDEVRDGAVSYLGMAAAVEVWHWARRVVSWWFGLQVPVTYRHLGWSGGTEFL